MYQNHNHIRYSSWDTEWDRQNFCHSEPFFTLLPPNNLENRNFEKMKKPSGDVTTLHMCTKNHDHMMYPSCDMECDRQNFLPSHFLPLYPTNNMKNHNFGKMKKRLEISFFYTCVPQTTIIWCMLPENGARQTEFLSFWTSFCLFTPQTTQKTKKNEKTPGDIILHTFTKVI